jgi:hypothetical protein
MRRETGKEYVVKVTGLQLAVLFVDYKTLYLGLVPFCSLGMGAAVQAGGQLCWRATPEGWRGRRRAAAGATRTHMKRGGTRIPT